MMEWYDWRDVPFEEYLHQEHYELPGVLIRHRLYPSKWDIVRSVCRGWKPTMEHLKSVCEELGEGEYIITPIKRVDSDYITKMLKQEDRDLADGGIYRIT